MRNKKNKKRVKKVPKGDDSSPAPNTLLPEDPPFFLRNDRKEVSGAIKIDGILVKEANLCVTGWAFGFSELVLLCDDTMVATSFKSIRRPDVQSFLQLSGQHDLGFEMSCAYIASGAYAIRAKSKAADQDIIFSIKTHDIRQDSTKDFYPLAQAAAPGGLAGINGSPCALGAIDKVFALGKGGMLILGWILYPGIRPENIRVYGANREWVDITDAFFRLPRADVLQAFADRFFGLTDMLGFVCHVALPTRPGESRSMRIHFGNDQDDVWLTLESTPDQTDGVRLIQQILAFIPSPEKMHHQLYRLFDECLGEPISFISSHMRSPVPDISQRQFGIPPKQPFVSIIVPLYGRCDFVRHQLAHFVDDPDFEHVDLIYVIDDPSLIAQTHEMAARYFPLFCIPFRLVWYDRNLGFAGANNVGAKMARSDTLLLLNSDVLPQKNGWITTLHRALTSLPQAGAVGPLLEFYDGSVQHAGMYPKYNDSLPGFLFNTHPGKGLSWTKSEEPSEHPMLTGACLMIRKADYEAVGGLDEGYLMGDFEDSDLCLQLRKMGYTLWLVPEAKLWHLERQSQNIGQVAGFRQLLTLYNGWRYTQKVHHVDIPVLKGEYPCEF